MSYVADDINPHIQPGTLVTRIGPVAPNQPRGAWQNGEVIDRLGDTVFVRWGGSNEVEAISADELVLDSGF
jgi:hypothetical protein